MAKQICSKCGYEGRGKRIGERRGGTVFRVVGLLTMIPAYTMWNMAGGKGGKQCPHCGLPTMVKVNSNAGRLARHLFDVEIGAVQVKKPEDTSKEGFGKKRPAEKVVTKKPVNPEEW